MNDNFDKKQQENAEKQEAGKNTAHVAAKGAATYFGGAVGGRAYDALSRTKAGQRLENTAGKVIAKTPGLGQINKKLNDTGAVDAANKAVDALNGQKTKKGLCSKKNSGNNKTNNESTPNALKNRQQASSMQRLQRQKNLQENRKEDSNKENENSEETDNYDENKEIASKRSFGIITLTPMQKLMLIGVLIGVVMLIVLFVMLFGAGGNIGFDPYIAPISSLNSNKEDKKTYYYDETQPEKLQEEINFNNALVGNADGSIPGIIDEYYENYGVNLNKYVIEGTLFYVYTLQEESKLDNMSEEELLKYDANNAMYDFGKALKYLPVVASMMLEESDGSYYTDTARGGAFYNKLIASSFLTEYYGKVLDKYNSRQQLVEEIYDYADLLRYFSEEQTTSSGVISDSIAIYLQDCHQKYRFKFINEIKVYDNPLVNEGSEYPLYLSFTDYIKGVIMSEVGGYMKEEYKEGLKAMMVAATTFMIGDSKAGFDLRSGEMYFPNGTCRQVSCDPTYGCSVIKKDGYSVSFSGYKRYSSGNHPPLNETQLNLLNGLLDEVFGEVMVKKGVTESSFSGSKDMGYVSYYSHLSLCKSNRCMGQVEAMNDAKNGMTYKEILAKYYDSSKYDLINIKEGLYVNSGGNYNGTIQLNSNFHYHQKDSPWASQKLCDSGDIGTNGCNITSAAIAISLLTNQRITPETLNNRQNEIKSCTQNSRPQMIMDFIKLYGLTTTIVNKNDQAGIQDMLQKLASGNFVVIARLTKNAGRYYTGSGHYITLVGVKTENNTNKVLVWDPGSRKASRDNYWADLNEDIVKYLNSSNSFIVVGRK